MQGRRERGAAAALAERASAGGPAAALAGAKMNVRSCNRFKELPCNSWPRAAAARALQRPRPDQRASHCPVAPHKPRSLRSHSRPCALSACRSLSAQSRSHLLAWVQRARRQANRARPGGRVCAPRCRRTSARQAGPPPAGAPGTQKRPHMLSRVSPLGGQPLSPSPQWAGQTLSGHGHNAIPGLALQALLAVEPDSASPTGSWADARALRARGSQQASAKPQSLRRAHSPRRAVAEPNKVVKQPHNRELGVMAQAIPGLPVSPTRAARSLPIYTLHARSAPQGLQFTGGRQPARRGAPKMPQETATRKCNTPVCKERCCSVAECKPVTSKAQVASATATLKSHTLETQPGAWTIFSGAERRRLDTCAWLRTCPGEPSAAAHHSPATPADMEARQWPGL